MNTELKNTVAAADAKAQYDECAKRILGQKSILSRILVKTVEEFQGMTPQEAQKDEPTKYDIINRSIFYVSRMISSQKGRDFEKTNYNDIRRVYSI